MTDISRSLIMKNKDAEMDINTSFLFPYSISSLFPHQMQSFVQIACMDFDSMKNKMAFDLNSKELMGINLFELWEIKQLSHCRK